MFRDSGASASMAACFSEYDFIDDTNKIYNNLFKSTSFRQNKIVRKHPLLKFRVLEYADRFTSVACKSKPQSNLCLEHYIHLRLETVRDCK